MRSKIQRNIVAEKIEAIARVLGEGFSFDVTHQPECGSFVAEKCDCNFVVTIKKQFGGTCASSYGEGPLRIKWGCSSHFHPSLNPTGEENFHEDKNDQA